MAVGFCYNCNKVHSLKCPHEKEEKMNTVIHEGVEYVSKEIPGHGMCLVPKEQELTINLIKSGNVFQYKNGESVMLIEVSTDIYRLFGAKGGWLNPYNGEANSKEQMLNYLNKYKYKFVGKIECTFVPNK